MRVRVCVCVCSVMVLEATEQNWPTGERASSGRVGVSKQAFPRQRAAADTHSQPEGPKPTASRHLLAWRLGHTLLNCPGLASLSAAQRAKGPCLCRRLFLAQKLSRLIAPRSRLATPTFSKGGLTGKLLALDKAHSEKCSAWLDSWGRDPKPGPGLAGEGGAG